MNTVYRELPPSNKLWNSRDAAYYLDMHIDTVKEKSAAGSIPTAGKTDGGQWRFRKSSLDAWLCKNKEAA